jgi:hypothetical protein
MELRATALYASHTAHATCQSTAHRSRSCNVSPHVPISLVQGRSLEEQRDNPAACSYVISQQ